MGEKLPDKEIELHCRIDEILHDIWDTIGIAGEAGARDEYYHICRKHFNWQSYKIAKIK